MRRWFLSLFVCLALLLGVRMAKAANIGLENVPGGAAITYWTCDNGYETLINVQNVLQQAMLVHIVFYDQNSDEIMDFNVPLSAFDNWGASVTCENGQLVVTPGNQPFYQGPNSGGETRWAPTNAVEGYVTVAITALDVAGIPNDARDDVNFRNTDRQLPNGIILRSAMVNYAAGNAFALNSFSLVNFTNIVNDGAGPECPINRSPVTSPADDMNGVRISMCELLAERNNGVFLNDFDNNPATPNTREFVVGSPNGQYWARYGNNDIVNTSFILIFPAQGGGNQLDITVFDDNEMTQSAYYEASEVAHILLGTDIAAFESGEVLITVRNRDLSKDTPPNPNDDPRPAFFGFSLVEGPNFVDIYPIVRTSFAYCDDNVGATGICSQF